MDKTKWYYSLHHLLGREEISAHNSQQLQWNAEEVLQSHRLLK